MAMGINPDMSGMVSPTPFLRKQGGRNPVRRGIPHTIPAKAGGQESSQAWYPPHHSCESRGAGIQSGVVSPTPFLRKQESSQAWYPPRHSCESRGAGIQSGVVSPTPFLRKQGGRNPVRRGIPHTIPAKAGIQSVVVTLWIPAFAGMAPVESVRIF